MKGKATTLTTVIIKTLSNEEISKLNGYILSGGTNYCFISVQTKTSYTTYATSKGSEAVINVSTEEGVDIFCRIQNGAVVDETIYPMISVNGGEYEKYTGGATPRPDYPQPIEVSGESGSVEVKSENEYGTRSTTATIPTENGLAGIKVSSNGNYTDQNGQQWLSDKKVKYADGSGEDVRRFVTVVFDGSDDEAWQDRTNDYTNKKDGQTRFSIRVDKPYDASREICAMSNIGYQGQIQGAPAFSKEGIALYTLDGTSTSTICYVTLNNPNVTDLATFKSWLSNNNIVLVYELATPIRTPLTAEEIAEIEKLHTFYPITNISNDFDCGMKVTYNCDSKNYIDNKLKEQAQAREQAMMSMFLLLPEETQASMIENDVNNLLESEI